MKILLMFILIALLSGCVTTYKAERTTADGVKTTIDVRSWREFPGGVKLYYQRETGTFKLEAGEVTSGSEAEAVRDIILGILPLIQPIKGG